MAGPKSPLSILFTHFGEAAIRGSEQVLINLTTHLNPDQYRPVVWCNAAPLAERLSAAGVTVHRSDFMSFFGYQSPRFSPKRYWSFIEEGLSLVRAHDVRLLHSNGAAPHQWMLPVSRRARLPLVAHLHAKYLRRERFATLLHQATAIVGVSESVITDFLADGFPRARAHVIHNGIDSSGYQPVPAGYLREKLGIPSEAILIGAVGALSPQKGMDLLIRAVAKLARPDVHLAIAGDGPEREPLRELADALGIGSRTHLLGYCSDIAPLYAASDIAALASRAEAFGMALAEAGLFCLPVVSCKVQGVPEVVEDRKSGILVPPNDVEAFAAALAQLCDQPQERRRMGLAGNIRTRQLFDVERMTGKFEALYGALLEQPMRPLAPFPYFNFLLKASMGTAARP